MDAILQQISRELGELSGRVVSLGGELRSDIADVKTEIERQRDKNHEINNSLQQLLSTPRVVEDHEKRLRAIEERQSGIGFKLTLIWSGIASLFLLVGGELVHLLFGSAAFIGRGGK